MTLNGTWDSQLPEVRKRRGQEETEKKLTSVRRTNKKGSDVPEARERCFKNKAVITNLLMLVK